MGVIFDQDHLTWITEIQSLVQSASQPQSVVAASATGSSSKTSFHLSLVEAAIKLKPFDTKGAVMIHLVNAGINGAIYEQTDGVLSLNLQASLSRANILVAKTDTSSRVETSKRVRYNDLQADKALSPYVSIGTISCEGALLSYQQGAVPRLEVRSFRFTPFYVAKCLRSV